MFKKGSVFKDQIPKTGQNAKIEKKNDQYLALKYHLYWTFDKHRLGI